MHQSEVIADFLLHRMLRSLLSWMDSLQSVSGAEAASGGRWWDACFVI